MHSSRSLLILTLVFKLFYQVAISQPNYNFPFKTQVDAKDLSCDYKTKELLSDQLKRFVRLNTPPISVEEQIQIGNKFHKEYLDFPIVNHPKEKMAKRIVSKMEPFLAIKNLKHKVYIIKSSHPNAFTISGGAIYITTKLLDQVEVEDELAFVIGHELGHNENHHTKESARIIRFAQETLDKVEDNNSPGLKRILIGLGGLTILKAHAIASGYFDQADELEADLSSLYLLYKAGYNPEKALGLMQKLKNWEGPPPEKEWRKVLEDLGRTHPWAEDRYNCAYNYVQEAMNKPFGCGKMFLGNKKGRVVTRSTALNVRSHPSIESKVIKKLPKGSIVTLICESSFLDVIQGQKGRWIQIKLKNGNEGWVWGYFIEEIKHQP